MDNTIRIITDSGCDISKENEEKYKGLLEDNALRRDYPGQELRRQAGYPG